MLRHLLNQPRARSTTQRRALRRFRPVLSSFSSPMRRMCGVCPCEMAAARPVGLSYPLSRQRCCGDFSVGFGRSTTIDSMVCSKSLQSWTLAPAGTRPVGPPAASTIMLRFVPGLPRSVGFGPTRSPQNAPCSWRSRHSANANRHRQVPRSFRSTLPTIARKRLS